MKTTIPNEVRFPDNGTEDKDANHAPFKRRHQARLMDDVTHCRPVRKTCRS